MPPALQQIAIEQPGNGSFFYEKAGPVGVVIDDLRQNLPATLSDAVGDMVRRVAASMRAQGVLVRVEGADDDAPLPLETAYDPYEQARIDDKRVTVHGIIQFDEETQLKLLQERLESRLAYMESIIKILNERMDNSGAADAFGSNAQLIRNQVLKVKEAMLAMREQLHLMRTAPQEVKPQRLGQAMNQLMTELKNLNAMQLPPSMKMEIGKTIMQFKAMPQVFPVLAAVVPFLNARLFSLPAQTKPAQPQTVKTGSGNVVQLPKTPAARRDAVRQPVQKGEPKLASKGFAAAIRAAFRQAMVMATVPARFVAAALQRLAVFTARMEQKEAVRADAAVKTSDRQAPQQAQETKAAPREPAKAGPVQRVISAIQAAFRHAQVVQLVPARRVSDALQSLLHLMASVTVVEKAADIKTTGIKTAETKIAETRVADRIVATIITQDRPLATAAISTLPLRQQTGPVTTLAAVRHGPLGGVTNPVAGRPVPVKALRPPDVPITPITHTGFSGNVVILPFRAGAENTVPTGIPLSVTTSRSTVWSGSPHVPATPVASGAVVSPVVAPRSEGHSPSVVAAGGQPVRAGIGAEQQGKPTPAAVTPASNGATDKVVPLAGKNDTVGPTAVETGSVKKSAAKPATDTQAPDKSVKAGPGPAQPTASNAGEVRTAPPPPAADLKPAAEPKAAEPIVAEQKAYEPVPAEQRTPDASVTRPDSPPTAFVKEGPVVTLDGQTYQTISRTVWCPNCDGPKVEVITPQQQHQEFLQRTVHSTVETAATSDVYEKQGQKSEKNARRHVHGADCCDAPVQESNSSPSRNPSTPSWVVDAVETKAERTTKADVSSTMVDTNGSEFTITTTRTKTASPKGDVLSERRHSGVRVPPKRLDA